MKRSALLAICSIIILFLAGCDENVKKGDRDYPQRNDQQKISLRVHGFNKSGVHINLKSYWIAKNAILYPVNKDSCSYSINWFEGVSVAYSITSPIEIKNSGDDFSFDVKFDEYLPGRCGWEFIGLFIYADGQDLENTPFRTKNLFSVFDPNRSKEWHEVEVTNNSMSIVCNTYPGQRMLDGKQGSPLKCFDKHSKNVIHAILEKDVTGIFELNIFKDYDE